MPGAVEALDSLVNANTKVGVISACGSDRDIVSARLANLTEVFGVRFDSVVCTPLGASKIDELARRARPNASFWVEDTYPSAMDGHLVGMQSFMVRAPYNRHLEASSSPDIQWVDDLRDLSSLFN
jgi:beta-phosphoglucomutase-like phosphatase (HAD superfamily)